MRDTEVTVINPLGLHARAAAQLVRRAAAFSSKITLYRNDDGRLANAKSILSLLALAAARGTAVRIQADGPDEQAAVDAIEALFVGGFGEL